MSPERCIDRLSVQERQNLPVLTQELADRINNACGNSLADELQLADIRGFARIRRQKWEFSQNPPDAWIQTGWELTPREKIQITSIVSVLQRNGYETIGQVRSTSLEDLVAIPTINQVKASFIQKVFEKPVGPDLSIRPENI